MPTISAHSSKEQFITPVSLFFLRNVSLLPSNAALVINDTRYTYHQLWEIADEIYHKIPQDETYEMIGIYCNNDVYTYAAILAVNLYGAAYVPLNGKFPSTKNRNYAEQCNLKLILSSVETDTLKIIAEGREVVYTNVDVKAISKKKVQTTEYGKVEQAVAYVLFTSGTTGEPKGVPVTHENVNHFFNFFLSNYDFNEKDRFLQVYELTFDVSVFSFFMPLISGACCYVLPDEGIKNVKTMEWLKKYDITVVSMVPTVLKYIAPYVDEISFPQLRYSFFSGDALPHDLAVKWKKVLPDGAIHNFYGPTETTIVCTRYVFDEERSREESVNGIVPIGKLFDGMDFLITDKNNEPVKKGELCISGTQVISAYLTNNYEDRFFFRNTVRYYKTGDIVSLNAHKNLVFYGRTDGQVKINGYRIELLEVEYVLSKITTASVIVMCETLVNGLNQLVAYIETKTVDENLLKKQLQSVLPDYMIPQHFKAVENFILNANGKVDKKQFARIK